VVAGELAIILYWSLHIGAVLEYVHPWLCNFCWGRIYGTKLFIGMVALGRMPRFDKD